MLVLQHIFNNKALWKIKTLSWTVNWILAVTYELLTHCTDDLTFRPKQVWIIYTGSSQWPASCIRSSISRWRNQWQRVERTEFMGFTRYRIR